MSHWYYRIQKGDGGLNKKPPRYKDLGEHSIRTFVREVIQNNLDAAINNEPIKIKFKIKEWKDSDINEFKIFLGKEHFELLEKSVADPDPSVKPYLRDSSDIIKNKKKSSFLIIVEESNCIGLTGPVRETSIEKSHFDALMRKVENNEAKKETSNTGGTWGKGSSIFTYTSGLWTWFSYSYLSKPWIDDRIGAEHKTRFIGRCILPPFFDVDKNQSYLGDGWYCDVDKFEKDNFEDCYPFINDEADKFAIDLGMAKRSKPGTTFFVPFFNPIIEDGKGEVSINSIHEEFLNQILQNWFIPVYNQELTIDLITDKDSVVINKSLLYQVPELKFKMELLDWYENNCPPNQQFLREEIIVTVPALKSDYITSKNEFAEVERKVKCDLLIRVLDEDEDYDDNWNTINKVGLTRNKGMLVDYEPMIEIKTFRTESLLLGGLLSKSENNFQKRQHLDLFLGYSENAAHSVWCRNHNDYERCFLDYFKTEKRKPHLLMSDLFSEIKRIFNNLIKDESMPTDDKEICSIFKQLAKLRTGGKDSTGISPFNIRKLEDIIDKEGRFIYKRRIISNIKEKSIEIIFMSYVITHEGEKNNIFDQLEISEFEILEILNQDMQLITSGNKPMIMLSPENEIVVNIRTCPIVGNPRFKNLVPFIKVAAKINTHE